MEGGKLMRYITRGNDEIFIAKVYDEQGNPKDLTNYTIRCEIKEAPEGADLISGVVTKTNPSQGEIQIAFSAADTAKLRANKQYYMDLEFTDPNGKKFNYPKPPEPVMVLGRVTD
jgi:hypothetical protein